MSNLYDKSRLFLHSNVLSINFKLCSLKFPPIWVWIMELYWYVNYSTCLVRLLIYYFVSWLQSYHLLTFQFQTKQKATNETWFSDKVWSWGVETMVSVMNLSCWLVRCETLHSPTFEAFALCRRKNILTYIGSLDTYLIQAYQFHLAGWRYLALSFLFPGTSLTSQQQLGGPVTVA